MLSKRELIAPKGDERYIRRDEEGQRRSVLILLLRGVEGRGPCD